MKKQSADPELSEEDLVELVLAGRTELWDQLAARTLRMIGKIVSHKVSQHDRDDVSQDAFIRFFNALPSYSRGRGTVRVFASVLTHRQIADYYGKNGRDADIADVEDFADLLQETSPGANPGPNLLPDLEAMTDPGDWKMIQMRLDGHPWDEIAVISNITAGAAKMRVRRALNDMRAWLDGDDA